MLTMFMMFLRGCREEALPTLCRFHRKQVSEDVLTRHARRNLTAAGRGTISNQHAFFELENNEKQRRVAVQRPVDKVTLQPLV